MLPAGAAADQPIERILVVHLPFGAFAEPFLDQAIRRLACGSHVSAGFFLLAAQSRK